MTGLVFSLVQILHELSPGYVGENGNIEMSVRADSNLAAEQV